VDILLFAKIPVKRKSSFFSYRHFAFIDLLRSSPLLNSTFFPPVFAASSELPSGERFRRISDCMRRVHLDIVSESRQENAYSEKV
jgi:hypothetical protein